MKDGFLLGLYTVGHREGIVNLKWNMIHEKDGKPSYIAVSNLKVERNLGDGYNENVKSQIIPITKGLMTILLDMGYENYKASDRFLVAPECSKGKTIFSTSEYFKLISFIVFPDSSNSTIVILLCHLRKKRQNIL